MADLPGFQKTQVAFAAHLRDPDNVPAPAGIEERRISIYRNLFFNNLSSLLTNTFPVTRKILGDDGWRSLVRSFMQEHRAQTPYFLQLPGELVAFVETVHERYVDDYPYLVELVHYEYVELALATAPDAEAPPGTDPDGDLLDGIPVKSALAWAFAYRYPVHRIAPDYIPEAPAAAPVCLALYRKPDDRIGFMEMNPVTAALLDAIDGNDDDLTGRALLEGLAAQAGYADVDAFVGHGAEALAELRSHTIIAGARPVTARS